MKIGTVICVDICGEEKTCVIINKKDYCDMLFEDDLVPAFLIRHYDPSDTGVSNVIIRPRRHPTIGKVLCYELMYGDNRVWVLGKPTLAIMAKASQQGLGL